MFSRGREKVHWERMDWGLGTFRDGGPYHIENSPLTPLSGKSKNDRD